jgi:hypothetical protein
VNHGCANNVLYEKDQILSADHFSSSLPW